MFIKKILATTTLSLLLLSCVSQPAQAITFSEVGDFLWNTVQVVTSFFGNSNTRKMIEEAEIVADDFSRIKGGTGNMTKTLEDVLYFENLGLEILSHSGSGAPSNQYQDFGSCLF